MDSDHGDDHTGINSSSSSSGGGGSSSNNTSNSNFGPPVEVSTVLLFVSTVPFLALILLSWKLKLDLESPMVVGLLRTFIQLSILGAILHPIFQWGHRLWWVVVLYILFMITLAALEASSRSKYYFNGMFEMVLTSILIVVGLVSIFAFGGILRPDPLWSPQYVIPIVGMLLGNCINGVALSLNALLTNLKEQSHEIEILMSFGASPSEASSRLVRESVRVGTMPMLNSMAVIGLISIPGMMTGQILGGSPPMQAAAYQILIIVLIGIVTVATILMQVWIVIRSVAFGEDEILRTDRFIERPAKLNFLGRLALAFQTLRTGMNHLCKRLQRQHRRVSRWLGGSKRSSGSRSSSSSGTLITIGSFAARSSTETEPLKLSAAAAAAETNEYYVAPKGKLEITTLKHAKIAGGPDLQQYSLKIHNVSRSVVQTGTTSSSHPVIANEATSGSDNSNVTTMSSKRMLFANLSFEIQAGDIVAVRGPSGVGKSQLLRLIAGLTPMDQPNDDDDDWSAIADAVRTSGSSSGDNKGKGDMYLAGMSRKKDFPNMALWRRSIRYVCQYKIDLPGTPREFVEKVTSFQSWRRYHHQVVPSSTNGFRRSDLSSGSIGGRGNETNRNNSLDPNNHPIGQIPPSQKEVMTTCLQYAQQWGLDASCMDTEWKLLSGGETQRVYVAIALATQPSVLLLDESTSALDLDTKLRVEQTIQKVSEERGMSVLLISHDNDQITRIQQQQQQQGQEKPSSLWE